MINLSGTAGNSPGKRVRSGTMIISSLENMILMGSELLKFANKSMTKKELLEKVKHNSHLIRARAERTILAFDLSFDRMDDKKKVISFVRNHAKSPRRTLNMEAESFLEKWGDNRSFVGNASSR